MTVPEASAKRVSFDVHYSVDVPTDPEVIRMIVMEALHKDLLHHLDHTMTSETDYDDREWAYVRSCRAWTEAEWAAFLVEVSHLGFFDTRVLQTGYTLRMDLP